jgi:hypothetical protein
MTDAEGRKRILVCANETVGGRALIDAVTEAAGSGGSVVVVCPQNQPREGWVVHEESVRSAAENRLQTTLAQLKQAGIVATGEVMDPDPYAAIMDAVALWNPDEIIISTHPETRSGWLRKHIVDRVEEETGLPVRHVVVDLDADRAEATHVLVVANQTVGSEELMRRLKERTAEGPHRFTVIMPQGEHGDETANARLAWVLEQMEQAGLEAVGQVMHPDPFTSIQNALQFYNVDEIVISTFPDEKSGWLRTGLIDRVRGSTSRPVEHVVARESSEVQEASS